MLADLESINSVDLFFIILTIAGVLFSSVMNFRAAKLSTGWMHRLFLTTAILSLFYVPAYALALTPLTSYQAWSSFMLGFSWVVWWGAPWSAFAVLRIYETKRMQALTKENELNSKVVIYSDGTISITPQTAEQKELPFP